MCYRVCASVCLLLFVNRVSWTWRTLAQKIFPHAVAEALVVAARGESDTGGQTPLLYNILGFF